MSKMAELKDLSVAEIHAQCEELSKEIFKMRNEISTAHKLDKPHLLRKAKRDRARLLTALNHKGTKS